MGKKTEGCEDFLNYVHKKTPKRRKSTADEHEDRFDEMKKQSTPPKIKVKKSMKF